MEGDTLRRTIYIYSLHIAMALDNTLARCIVGIAACLSIVRQDHQTVILVPEHLTSRTEAVIFHQRWVAVGIIRIMLMADLRRSSRMGCVLIKIVIAVAMGRQ